MRKQAPIALFFVFAWTSSQGQQMNLTSGTITVAQGTTMVLEGPLEWTLAPGASLINNGAIELGNSGRLVEQPGQPVTGTGTETAQMTATVPFTNEEPGNLGLTMSASTGSSPITVVRGHGPWTFPEGDSSIARWFQVIPSPSVDWSMDLVLDYDPTELNALNPANLSLFHANDANGPWTLLSSSADVGAHSVSGNWFNPGGYITAFDMDAPTASPSLVAEYGFNVFPTLVTDVVHIVALDHQAIERVELYDGLGRSTPIDRSARSLDHVQIMVPNLSAGAYFLRVNGQHVFKLRVP